MLTRLLDSLAQTRAGVGMFLENYFTLATWSFFFQFVPFSFEVCNNKPRLRVYYFIVRKIFNN